MHDRYSRLRSVTRFIFSLCEQAIALQKDSEWKGDSDGGGGRHALNETQSNHSSIWMIWNSSVLPPYAVSAGDEGLNFNQRRACHH